MLKINLHLIMPSIPTLPINFINLRLVNKAPSMTAITPCPKCQSTFTYPMDNLLVCPECFNEWDPSVMSEEELAAQVLDANGNVLQNGDTVVVIKDLPVKGAPKAIKAGTKVKNIRLTDGDHNIDCKIDGFGSMALKSEFVRKG